MIEMNVHNKNKVAFHYDITLACNNRCSYCYMLPHLDQAQKTNPETMENVKKAIKDLQIENPDLEVSMVFVGGEPLLIIDEIRDIMEHLDGPKIEFQVFSNVNFKPGGGVMQKLMRVREQFDNFVLKISWHESSNQEYLKANIKACEDFACVTFLVQDSNFDATYENYKWIQANTNAVYNFEEIRDHNAVSAFTKTDDPRYIELLKNSHDKDVINTIGDEVFDLIESQDLMNVSSYYHTICRISEMCITYNGDITPMCFHVADFGNVRDGIKIHTRYCNNYHCRNVICTYKQLGAKKK